MRPGSALAIGALSLLAAPAFAQPKAIYLQSFEGTQLQAEAVRISGKDFSGGTVTITISRDGPLNIVIAGSLGSSKRNFRISVTGIPSKTFNIQDTAIWFPFSRTTQIGIQIPYGEFVEASCFAPGQDIAKNVTLMFDATHGVVASSTDFSDCAAVRTPLEVTKAGRTFLVKTH